MPYPVFLHTYKSLCQLKLTYAATNMWKHCKYTGLKILKEANPTGGTSGL
jgi:hypothetical protein